jgi:hypothetical protein
MVLPLADLFQEKLQKLEKGEQDLSIMPVSILLYDLVFTKVYLISHVKTQRFLPTCLG